MHILRFGFIVYMCCASAFGADITDKKSELLHNATVTGDRRVIDSIAVGGVGTGLGVVAQASAAKQSDAESVTDMNAWLDTFYCTAGDVRAPYGETVELSSDELSGLRNEYVQLLSRTREQAYILGIEGPGADLDYSDERSLYDYATAPERAHVLSTASERAATNDDDELMNIGLAVALDGAVTGMLMNAGVDLWAPNKASSSGDSKLGASSNPSAPVATTRQTSATATKPASAASVQSQSVTTWNAAQTSVKTNSSQSSSSATSSDDSDEIAELCAEFPDEPECEG